jgi:hypothetical protein
MFDKAVSFQNKSQKVNAILLTNFDTVSDKDCDALTKTKTHVTNAPILCLLGHREKIPPPSKAEYSISDSILVSMIMARSNLARLKCFPVRSLCHGLLVCLRRLNRHGWVWPMMQKKLWISSRWKRLKTTSAKYLIRFPKKNC